MRRVEVTYITQRPLGEEGRFYVWSEDHTQHAYFNDTEKVYRYIHAMASLKTPIKCSWCYI